MRGHAGPVVIEVALNGSTPRSVNPTVPIEPDEVAEQGLACIEAGAAIVHSHPRSPTPGHDVQDYVSAWSILADASPDVMLYPTARLTAPDVEDSVQWGHHDELAERGLLAMGLVDPGSVNLGMGLDGSVRDPFDDVVYINSHAATRYRFSRCADLRVSPSISIFDPSFLRATLGFIRAGQVPSGSLIKLYFGGDELFGLRPTVAALDAYLELMDGVGLPWSAAVLGGDLLEGGFGEAVLARGGHLRVGLEDMTRPGVRSNRELVVAAAELVEGMGLRVASPAMAREIINVPRR